MKKPLPHVIYFLSDEHRGQAVGHLGDPNVRTPMLDRLAAEGVSFARAYANCPVCVPSRGTIFSGRHAHAGPLSSFRDVFKATAPSTATLLRQAGYRTAYLGKWHCGVVENQTPADVRKRRDEFPGSAERTPERHRAGFQDWCGFENLNAHFNSYYYRDRDVLPTKLEGYETDALTELAIGYLRRYDRPEPLFLVVSVTPPHFPMIVPDRWKRFDAAGLKVPPNFVEIPEHREALAVYYAMIENIDWNIGRLVGACAALPRFGGNTVTAYFSDHGDFMGSHGRACAKMHPHEESVRIPAVFHGPGVVARGVVPELFSLVDFLPTTLGLLGVPVPSHVQGADFSPLLRAESFDGPDAVLLEMVGAPRHNLDSIDWRGFVTDRWKYAFYETGKELLFDLERDPFEMNNRAVLDPELRDRMRNRLLAMLAATREPYFDVLINDGVDMNPETIDVRKTP